MSFPKHKRFESKAYIKWVLTQDCVMCGQPGHEHNQIVPHHLIGIGGIAMGTGTKAGDEWAMPAHKLCHDAWHADKDRDYQAQWEWAARTLTNAIEEGILEVVK